MKFERSFRKKNTLTQQQQQQQQNHTTKNGIYTHVFNNKSPNKMFALQNQSSRFKWRLIILFDILEVKWTHTKKTNVILYKKMRAFIKYYDFI